MSVDAPRARRRKRLMITLVAIIAAAGIAWQFLRTQYDRYTDPAPLPLAAPALTPAQLDALFARVDAFQRALAERRPQGSLTLTEDELNALLATSPSWSGKARAIVEGDQLKAMLSLPVEDLGLPGTGRYLNGTSTIDMDVEDGSLAVHLGTMEVKGRPVPERLMSRLRRRNLAPTAATEPDAAMLLRRLGDVTVEGGRVTVQPR